MHLKNNNIDYFIRPLMHAYVHRVLSRVRLIIIQFTPSSIKQSYTNFYDPSFTFYACLSHDSQLFYCDHKYCYLPCIRRSWLKSKMN